MKKQSERIVKYGFWRFGGLLKKGVQIKAINYDFWYELEKAEGLDVSHSQPELNENGEMYLISWTDAQFKKQESIVIGTLDISSTVKKAEATINQKIRWVKQSVKF